MKTYLIETEPPHVPDRADGCPCGKECLTCAVGNHNGCVRRRERCSVNEGIGPIAISILRADRLDWWR